MEKQFLLEVHWNESIYDPVKSLNTKRHLIETLSVNSFSEHILYILFPIMGGKQRKELSFKSNWFNKSIPKWDHFQSRAVQFPGLHCIRNAIEYTISQKSWDQNDPYYVHLVSPTLISLIVPSGYIMLINIRCILA